MRTGKRNLAWRTDKPASLSFFVALDGGDPAQKVPFRDELFQWDAPFDQEPVSLAKSDQRLEGVFWGNDKLAVMVNGWYDTRSEKCISSIHRSQAKHQDWSHSETFKMSTTTRRIRNASQSIQSP